MEGTQTTLIILKLLSDLFYKISRILEKGVEMYLQHKQFKRQLGLKSGKMIRADRREISIAKALKRNLTEKENAIQEKISVAKYNLDEYKIEMQRKLEDHDVLIKKAQRAFDIEKEKFDINRKNENYPKEKLAEDKKNLAELQIDIDNNMELKRDFETSVNKKLLKMNDEISKLETEHKELLADIKICDKSIDGFSSNFARDITESVRNDFESIVDKEKLRDSEEIEKNKDKHDIDKDRGIENKNDDFIKEYLEKQKRKSLSQNMQKEATLER